MENLTFKQALRDILWKKNATQARVMWHYGFGLLLGYGIGSKTNSFVLCLGLCLFWLLALIKTIIDINRE